MAGRKETRTATAQSSSSVSQAVEASSCEDDGSDSDPNVDYRALRAEFNAGRTPRRKRGRPAKVKVASKQKPAGGARQQRGQPSARCGTAAAAFLASERRRRQRQPAAQPAHSSESDSAVRTAAGKVWTVSLTAVIPRQDIPLAVFDAIGSYVRQYTRAGSVSTECGGGFKHLHVQGVYKKRSTSVRMLKKLLQEYLAQHVQNYQELGVSLCLKAATNKGLHTWEGLIGYSMKHQGREDYRNVLHNVSVLEVEEGHKLLLLHGAAMKNRIPLTQRNIMERAACFLEYELRSRLIVSLAAIVYAMCTTGQYYLDPEWVVPYMGKGMDAAAADVVWRSCIAPTSLSLQDIQLVLFVPPDRYFVAVSTAREAADDQLLEQLLERALQQDKSLGEVIDGDAQLRPLLYHRATDRVLQRPRQQQMRQQRQPAIVFIADSGDHAPVAVVPAVAAAAGSSTPYTGASIDTEAAAPRRCKRVACAAAGVAAAPHHGWQQLMHNYSQRVKTRAVTAALGDSCVAEGAAAGAAGSAAAGAGGATEGAFVVEYDSIAQRVKRRRVADVSVSGVDCAGDRLLQQSRQHAITCLPHINDAVAVAGVSVVGVAGSNTSDAVVAQVNHAVAGSGRMQLRRQVAVLNRDQGASVSSD